jgi:hypothetical protein
MMEQRCPHGFLRSVVRCTEGCASPAAVELTSDGNIRRRPATRKRRAPAERRPSWRDVGDASIIVVLGESATAVAAARRLGTTQCNLWAYARTRPEVWEAYRETAKRGMAQRGQRGRESGFRGR